MTARRPLRLRSHLIALFLLAMAPLLAFSVYMIYRSAEEERATFRRGAIERTRAIMTAVDSELKSSITTLQALATSDELDRDDLRGFYDVAMRVFLSQRDWTTINLGDASAHRLMDLLYPFGSSDLPPVAEPDAVKRVFDTQTIAIGNLVLGPTSGKLDFGIRVPVVRDGRSKYVLSAVVKPAVIGAVLAKQEIPPGWVLAVIDRRGGIIARTLEHEHTVGRPAAADLREALGESSEGWRRGRSLEGEDVYRAYTRSPFSGWSVSLNVPAAVVDAPLHGTPLLVALFGLGLTLLGVALALVFSRRTAEAIEALSEMARGIGLGEESAAAAAANNIPSRIAEVDKLREGLSTAARLIEERARERDAFERELWQQASLLELSHDAIFVFEFPAGSIAYWNRGAEALYGYTKAEAIGKSPGELLKTFHPKGRDALIAGLETSGEYIGELIHTARDGRKVYVESRLVLAPQQDGRPLVLETCRDISERRRDERRAQVQARVNGILALAGNLQQAAPKLVEALGTLGEWDMCSIWDWDAAAEEFVCIEAWVSPSADLGAFKARTLGHRTKLRARKGLLGRVMESGEPTWVADAAADPYYARRALAAAHDIHAAFCFPIKLAERVLGFVECYGREVRPPDPDFVETLSSIGAELGQFIERTRAEEEARLFSRLPAESPAPVIRLTAAGAIAFANPAAAVVLDEWSAAVGGAAPPAIADIARAALARGQRRAIDLVLRECAYTVTFAPIVEANYVNLYFTDITERRRMEEERQKLNEELELRVQERTAELERSLAERASLEVQLQHAQRMEALGTLAGGIAHDFNNILGIVLGWARELKKQNGSSEALDAIISSGERGASIVKQLLAFSRKESIVEKPVAVNAMIKETAAMLRALFPKNIEVETALGENVPDILGDAHQLEQALINICMNACDAMPGGGRLAIRTARDASAAPPAAPPGNYISIEITDTGAGMDEATRRRIFEPFFTTKQGGGTGLGLAVVYGIVQAHGGAIDVASAPGAGTTFKLYLPIPERMPAEPERPRTAEPIAGSATLLVIDDEPLLARLLKESAERRGFRVLTAGDGLEGVATFERHGAEIDAVVLDCGLPKLSGPEVFRRLKELNSEVVVVGVTGYLDPEVKSRLLQEGLREFLQKPCSPDEILAKVQSCIAESAR